MRNLLSNISIFGNVIVRQGNQLIVRGEVLRSLCANSIEALAIDASLLLGELADALRSWPGTLCGMKPRVRMALCFATVKQTPRRHYVTCHRTAA
ncbi:MAG: hypothetical protein KDA57_15320 [Planctomycetales bacterium]|nr:hypothetical protein [Planctomycetales bacterium]